MSSRVEIPFPPRPSEPRVHQVEPPWVPVLPTWEYKELTRDLESGAPLTEAELNELGAQHWELAGVLRDDRQVHFYFKRERNG
jgi:hypothetical protein